MPRPKLVKPTQSNLVSPTQSNLASPTQSNLVSPTQSNLVSPTQSNLVSPTQSNLASPTQTNLGLVCQTHDLSIRYKTLTRTRYLGLSQADKPTTLQTLYRHNLGQLREALGYCHRHGIHLYRMPSDLFVLCDLEDGVGQAVLDGLSPQLALIGPLAEALGIRMLAHPDQFVVLSSEKPQVVRNSLRILERHADQFDRMGLPQSAWAAINIHGGKGGRSAELVAQIKDLPDRVRLRLTLENDERAYGAQEILQVCQRAEVPMMFDAHHHLVREKLGSYEDPSIAEFVGLARQTWNPSHWQVLHISNGHEGLHDNRHHELVGIMPSAYREAQWIEVEAKGKEVAIGYLRKHWTD